MKNQRKRVSKGMSKTHVLSSRPQEQHSLSARFPLPTQLKSIKLRNHRTCHSIPLPLWSVNRPAIQGSLENLLSSPTRNYLSSTHQEILRIRVFASIHISHLDALTETTRDVIVFLCIIATDPSKCFHSVLHFHVLRRIAFCQGHSCMDSLLQHLRVFAVLSFILFPKYLFPRSHCWAVGASELGIV